MKVSFLLLIAYFIIGCSGDTSTEITKEANYNSTKSEINIDKKGYPSAEAIAQVEKPILGGPADIAITIVGAQPGYKSNLIGFYAEKHLKADTTSIGQDYTIRFKREEGYDQGMYYVGIAKDRYLQILLGEDQVFTMRTTFTNPDGDMVVEGSDDNQAFFENIAFETAGKPKFAEVDAKLKTVAEGTPQHTNYKAEQKALINERKAHLNKLYTKFPNSFFTKFKKAGQNPDVREDVSQEEIVYHYRQDFWNDVDFSDSRLLRTPVINNKLKRFFEEITPQNQDSIFKSAQLLMDKIMIYPDYYKFIANWIILKYEPTKTTLMDPEYVFSKMAQTYVKHDRAFWYDSLEVFAIQQKAGEMANSVINNKGPNVTAKDLQGVSHTLLDNDEDYLIIYMYSPNCEHCIEQTPKLVDWYHEWTKKESVDVFAIALDTNNDELQQYIDKTKMPFPCVYDPTNRSIYGKYYVDLTPEIYVLNKERIIIGKNLKVNQIEIIINRDKEKRNK